MVWYNAGSCQNVFQSLGVFYTAIYKDPTTKQEIVNRFLKKSLQKESCPKISYFASKVALISM